MSIDSSPLAGPAGLRSPASTRAWLDSRALVILALTAIALVLRAPLFGNPVVHADEQFYLFVGDRMLHGALPFVDIWDRKPVGLFLLFAGIRRLGGDGIYQYQIAATLCAIATALLIRDLARPLTSARNAFLAGLAYLVYMLMFDGDGGQSPVFYNLLVVGAVRIMATQPVEPIPSRRATLALLGIGTVVTFLFGVAIQIKYTAVFEGAYFGIVLWLRGARLIRSRALLALAVVWWAACALAPTIAAMAAYAHLGHLAEFVQANFLSVFHRHQAKLPAIARVGLAALGLMPLAGCAILGATRPDLANRGADLRPLLIGWALAAIAGYLLFGSYYDHYGLPLLPPLCVLAAPGFGTRERWYNERFTLAFALAVGVVLTGWRYYDNGSARQFARLNALVAKNLHGCLFVFEGPSILYKQTGACFVTRYVFPSHLNNNKEADAIGVDTMAETRRVLATRPSVIVMRSEPQSSLTNLATRALVLQAVGARYRLAGEVPLGEAEMRVYALRSGK